MKQAFAYLFSKRTDLKNKAHTQSLGGRGGQCWPLPAPLASAPDVNHPAARHPSLSGGGGPARSGTRLAQPRCGPRIPDSDIPSPAQSADRKTGSEKSDNSPPACEYQSWAWTPTLTPNTKGRKRPQPNSVRCLFKRWMYPGQWVHDSVCLSASQWGQFCLQGTLGNIWGRFWLSELKGGEIVLASRG